ncbi:MAG: ATP-binding protein, partial [Candidatus Omnitrophica bacterium]|nr:ATP-binding protein [Candidatus Omnitrophota bacterium]
NFTEKIKSRILEEKKINNEEMYLVAKNKVQIPVSFSASLLASGTGDFSGIVCVIRDITEQKITENILLEDEQKLRKQTTKLETALSESEKNRRIMLSMLEDNNIIRQRLEDKINELNQTRDRLLQSEKLASLGRLTSSMAHEVNNPLQVVSGRTQLSLMAMQKMKHKPEEMHDIARNLQIVMNQCMRAKTIIQRLLLFSKPGKRIIKNIDISKSVEFIIGLVEKDFLIKGVTVIRRYRPDLPCVDVDEEQMQEVFVNLLNNAAEAMPGGGTITVEIVGEGGTLVMRFTDTGAGIPPEYLQKIFDPFFTTKEMGTGLGLSVCYGIIKSHGGELKYDSSPGVGTTATITLPVAKHEKE